MKDSRSSHLVAIDDLHLDLEVVDHFVIIKVLPSPFDEAGSDEEGSRGKMWRGVCVPLEVVAEEVVLQGGSGRERGAVVVAQD